MYPVCTFAVTVGIDLVEVAQLVTTYLTEHDGKMMVRNLFSEG